MKKKVEISFDQFRVYTISHDDLNVDHFMKKMNFDEQDEEDRNEMKIIMFFFCQE